MFAIMYSQDGKNKKYFSGKGRLVKTIKDALLFPDTYREQAEQMVLKNETMELKSVEVNPIQKLLINEPMEYSRVMSSLR